MPNFEEIWPSNKDKNDKYKRRLIGMEYYLDAMEHHGLKGHLPQPENFTTCGKLGIEINQYNCPIEVSREKKQKQKQYLVQCVLLRSVTTRL